MKYGVIIFPTDYAIRADELAKAVEQRGFESIFFPEHTHIPISRGPPTRWAANYRENTPIHRPNRRHAG